MLRRPFVWFAVAVTLGSAAYDLKPYIVCVVAVVAYLTAFILDRKHILGCFFLPQDRFLYVLPALFVMSFFHSSCIHYHYEQMFDEYEKIVGESIEVRATVKEVYISDEGCRIILKDVRLKEKNRVKKLGNCTAYISDRTGMELTRTEVINPGDIVDISGKISTQISSKTDGVFDTKSYALSQKNYGFIFVKNINVCGRDRSLSLKLRKMLGNIRNLTVKRIYECYPERYAGLLSGIYVGDKKGIPEDIKELYSAVGISHVLAISGLHISIFGMGFFRVLKKLYMRDTPAAVIAIAVLTCYVIMTGMSVGAVRAYLTTVVYFVALFMRRNSDGLNTLAFTYILILLDSPYMLTQIGFLLTFLAVASIMISEKLNINAGVFVWLATLPVILGMRYELCIYSVLANIPAVMILPYVFLMGMMSITMSGISEKIGNVLVKPVVLILSGEESLCRAILCLPYARILTGHPKKWAVFVYYLLLVIGAGMISYWKQNRIKGRLALTGCMIPAFVILCCFNKIGASANFIDVGQGDCVVLIDDKGHVVMNDCGSSDIDQIYAKRVKNWLKYNAIGEIDAIFVSHSDTDHINGITEMIKECPENNSDLIFGRMHKNGNIIVKNLFCSFYSVNDEKIQQLYLYAIKKGISTYEIRAGDSIKIGEQTIKCIWPEEKDVSIVGINSHNYDKNLYSIVLLWSYADNHILLTGDSTTDAESRYINNVRKLYPDIINEKLILKAAHHGSDTGTGEELLENLNFDKVIISCGKNNRYGHPSPKTIKRILLHNYVYFCTNNMGTISLKMQKHVNKISREKTTWKNDRKP